MPKETKISDEQLKKEIEKGKTQEEIAEEYNMHYPSQTISNRVQNMGIKTHSLFTIQDFGGAVISIRSGILDKAQNLSDAESFTVTEKNDDGEVVSEKEKLFKYDMVVEDPDSFELEKGDIVMRLSENAWRKEKS